jgi:hypothetical protein
VCVGVSSYADTKEDATAEATEAALEAFTNALDQRIGNDPFFAQQVRKIYSDNRQRLLADLETAKNDPDGAAWDTAKKKVRDARHNVSNALRKTGGTFVPPTSDQYWEEYQPLVGTGSRFLVVVRYTFPTNATKQLTALYSTPVEAEGAKVVTAFPAVAWRFPDVVDGAIVVATNSEQTFGRMGLAPQYVILSVNGRKVGDAGAFAETAKSEVETLKQKSGDLRIEVKRDDGPSVMYSSRIEGESVTNKPQVIIRTTGGGDRPGQHNVWGASQPRNRDNPNE